MSSDYIRVTIDGRVGFINAYRVNAVVVDEDGDTLITLNVAGQATLVDESAEEVVAMIDRAVNGEAVGSVNLEARSFLGREG